MEFGRFCFARGPSLLVFSLVLLFGSNFRAWSQQTPSSAPTDGAMTLPAAVPISQAAIGSAHASADSANATQNSPVASPVATAVENTSMLKLSAGDLLEVGVYNVPELRHSKARVWQFPAMCTFR